MNKNKTVLLGLLISILTLSLIASTYAFVRLSTTNQSNFRASLKAGTMSLVFSDGNPGFNTQISLGGSVEKIFTIENTGQGEAYATMSWKELQNTYTPGSLVYTLEESSDGGLTYTNRVSETNVPTSNTELIIAENLTIPVHTTMYYKLTISYIFLEGVNQTQDLHAYLNTLFTLEEGSFIDKAVLINKNNSNYWSSDEYADKIKTASFVQGINIPDNAIVSWDMSTAEDGRIVAYLANNENSTEETPLYDLYIATDRMKIYSNTSASDVFYNLSNLESINNMVMFNTANAISMRSMFRNCNSLASLDLSNFDTSNVTHMSQMFSGCSSLTSLDLSNFDTTKVTYMNHMFEKCKGLINLNLSSFNTPSLISIYYMFSDCENLISLDLKGFNTLKIESMSYLFSKCLNLTNLNISNFDTSNVTNMDSMFNSCKSLTSLDLSNFDTSNVTSMYAMFSNCTTLINLNIDSFNTSSVSNMGFMFNGCRALVNLNVFNFITNASTSMEHMFSECCNLTNMDLSSFDTSKVTDMCWMFYKCTNLKTIYVSELWNISLVTSSYYMFDGSAKLVGGAGTTYNSSYTDITYAHIDEGATNPGYLTLKV